MPVDNGRTAAWAALNDVLLKRAYADLAAKERFKELDARDARFARKLLYQTLDKLIAIDSAVVPYLDVRLTPDKVLNALRLGACQLMYMNAVPDFAAVDSTIEIIKQDGFMTRAGLVNAVLRNIIKEGKQPRLPDRAADPAGHLSVKYSWPRFVAEMWLKERPQHAEALLAWEPRFHAAVRANGLAGYSAEELEEYLKANEIEYERGALVPEAFRIRGNAEITKSELFKAGKIAVQGEASQLVSLTAAKAAGPGASILDACAAPGGKSACIAGALCGDCSIAAWDVKPHKIEMMKETFSRLHVTSAEPELHDARFADPRRFDLALVDAPCSGLGVAWGNPDIKVSRRPEDIAPMTVTQRKILNNAAQCVRVGGKLLYSTCTICRAENENIIAGFLRLERAFRPGSLAELLPDSLKGRVENGCMLQLLPPLDGCEGFFMALLQRVK
jgi:16S rRNA (cytosine967-C5)-methyltransferase